MHVTHLNKNGSGMTSMTACGRNILRTPLCVKWNEFKNEPAQYRCTKCVQSKQFELNTRMDERRAG